MSYLQIPSCKSREQAIYRDNEDFYPSLLNYNIVLHLKLIYLTL